jgi:5'-phosphate synthase pdxT subunit
LTDYINIGVLSIQGDIEENIDACKKALVELGIPGKVYPVKYSEEIQGIDGLIIPGGESTVISSLMLLQQQKWQSLKQKKSDGMPVLGTCAGMIILSNKVYDRTVGETRQELLKNLDIIVERNAFGRQHESFEADLEIPLIGNEPFKGIFIRGPIIKETGENVKVLSKYNGNIVAVQQKNIIGTSFHPELTEDTRIHKQFILKIIENKNLEK